MEIKTPRGRVFHTETGKAALEWNTNFSQKWSARYSNAQKYVDSEVLRLCEPYLPFRTGMLIKLGILGTTIGSGTVVWLGPYARFLYYGKVMVGIISRSAYAHKGEKKVVTDKNLTFHGGGVRGAFWFKRMKEVSGQQIVVGAKRFMGGNT